MSVLVNPAPSRLGTANAVIHGRSRRYDSRFAGPLSIKGVLAGTATWETAAGRFTIAPGALLLVHAREEYAIEVAAPKPVETFCLFFEDGFVEDAWNASTRTSATLLDAPGATSPLTFAEPLRFDAALVEEMNRAHRSLRDGLLSEEAFYAAAMLLVRARSELERGVARLPALRASTREELARRVAIGTAFLHASVGRRITVGDAARASSLSPFHFHRLFTAFHGVTPHRYLTRLRLAQARTLLRADERTVADVASACGFESLGSFTTLFTRACGVSPARFRRIGETAARSADLR